MASFRVSRLEDVLKDIADEYEEQPREWRIFKGRFLTDEHTYSIIISGPARTRHLKLESAYKPNPLVVWREIDEYLPKGAKGVPYFGMRPLPDKLARQAVRAFLKQDSAQLFKILEQAFTANPVTSAELMTKESAGILQGPVFRGPLEYISEKQRRLDAKLATEMRRLVAREYPMYG